MGRIILFDGICNLCNQSVQFIIKRDPKGYFQFASLQSEVGRSLLARYNIKQDMQSIILIDEDKYYTKADAALRICSKLKGLWKLISIFIIIPSPILDIFYNLIAKNRYKWFGKTDHCMLPNPEVKKRFLE